MMLIACIIRYKKFKCNMSRFYQVFLKVYINTYKYYLDLNLEKDKPYNYTH